MNAVLNGADWAALSPLLILLAGALLSLLLETFATPANKQNAETAIPVNARSPVAPSGEAEFGAAGFCLVQCSLNFLKGISGAVPLTILACVAALCAAVIAPGTDNLLLTPWLKLDSLYRIFTVLFMLIGIGTAFLSSSFFQRFNASQGEFCFLLLSALFGLVLIAASADFLTLFLGIETLSIALYVMCGYMKKWSISHEAAVKYFLTGALSTAFLLYGIALVYGATGTTRFQGLLAAYSAFAVGPEKFLFLGGIALITVGLAFKAAIVPAHTWAPDVYEGASTPVTAFMAVGTKAGAFAAFIRVFFDALPQFDPIWNEAVALLAYPTLIYANFVALRQVQMRRFFAYSGISQAGFLLIPLAAGTPNALQAMLFYLAVYTLATLGCFAVLASLDHTSEGVFLNDLQGLMKRRPFLAAIFALCLMTLGGIPPTAGFFAKFYVFKVAFQTGYYGLVVVGLLTTILSAYYYLRIIGVMLGESPSEMKASPRSYTALTVGTFSFAALIFLAVYPAPLLDQIATLSFLEEK